MSRYQFIATEREHYPVRPLCQVLSVPASGYYAWQAGQQRAGEGSETPAWETALVKVFGQHKRRYGTRRLQVALRQKGHRVGRQRLRMAMQRRGLHAPRFRRHWPRKTPEVRPHSTASNMTNSGHCAALPGRRALWCPNHGVFPSLFSPATPCETLP